MPFLFDGNWRDERTIKMGSTHAETAKQQLTRHSSAKEPQRERELEKHAKIDIFSKCKQYFQE